jgi:hypothetical protein
VLTQGRLQIRSWMFIYLGLLAAIIMAGPPDEAGMTTTEPVHDLPVIGESPSLRHDI